jgi:hypothetical protein
LIPLPPAIAGMERKKENSAATVRLQPRSIAPKMVVPLRDVPGTSARHCIRPISNAVL